MPFNNAKSLSANEVYAVTAYVLNLNEVVAADAVLNENSLPAVAMPNREGFTLAHGFMHTGDHGDVQNTACMRDCPVAVAVQSALPEHFTAQMYGDIRTHFRQLAAPSAAATAANNKAARDLDHTPTKLARQAGCLVCHGIDATVIGPAFRAVAQRYPDQSGAQATLVAKVRHGGAGVWGSTAMPPQTGITDDQLARLVSWIVAGAKDD